MNIVQKLLRVSILGYCHDAERHLESLILQRRSPDELLPLETLALAIITVAFSRYSAKSLREALVVEDDLELVFIVLSV